MKKIPINKAREIAKLYECDMLIIYGFDTQDGDLTGEYVQTTYGRNKELCGKTKELANMLIDGREQAVISEQGISPYCPNCGSGEWMTNEDEAPNNYCGQCGTRLDWGGSARNMGTT